MESKHTPGPWEFSSPTMAGNERAVIEAYGFGSICAISLNGAPRSQSQLAADSPYYQEQIPTMEANARLIVAAPQLLVACKRAVEQINEEAGIEFSWNDESASVAPRFLHDAIAEAEGTKQE